MSRVLPVVACVLVTLLAACERPAPPPGPAPGPASASASVPGTAPAAESRSDLPSILSNDGTWRLTYRLVPEPMVLDHPVEVVVEIRPAGDDRSLSPDTIELAFDAQMPQAGVKLERDPLVERRGAGVFAISGFALTYPGYWELRFDVVNGEVVERAQLGVMVPRKPG